MRDAYRRTRALRAVAASLRPGSACHARGVASEILESWRDGYAPLFAACRTRFAFLEQAHGYAAAELDVKPPSGVVIYRRDDGTELHINCEYSGTPWVVVNGGEPRLSYGVHEMIALLAPEHETKRPEVGDTPTESERDAVLDYYADFLREHGDAALRAEPQLWQELAEARRKRIGL